jgi:hypothetical protein
VAKHGDSSSRRAADTGTPVIEDYVTKMPLAFQGKLVKLVIELAPPAPAVDAKPSAPAAAPAPAKVVAPPAKAGH